MQMVDMLLKKCREVGASDLHLTVGVPPTARHNGALKRLKMPPFTTEQMNEVVRGMLTDTQWQLLEERKEIDLAYITEEGDRCRTCVCLHHSGYDVVSRLIPKEIPGLRELGFPDVVIKLLQYHQGMILVTGQAGCGKSTTLASMVKYINDHRPEHIICLEEPIEFLHQSKKCHIIQREVGKHTNSFGRALRAALREDPDVILVGEMRDLETMSNAITAAETGHLVLGTLHTTSADRTITRILDVFPPNQQGQIRTMVSESLRGIISQQLVPRADGQGRVLAIEVLVCTPAIGNLIREDRTPQISSQMQVGAKLGMKLMDDSLYELLQRGVITQEVAMERATDPVKFRNLSAMRKEQIEWDAFRMLQDKDKMKMLLDKGTVVWNRREKQVRPVDPNSIAMKFYRESGERLPEEEIFDEIVRLYPGAGRPVDGTEAPG